MREQLLQKMITLVDQDLQDIEERLQWLDRAQDQRTDLLIEKVELLRVKRELEEDLHGQREQEEEKERLL